MVPSRSPARHCSLIVIEDWDWPPVGPFVRAGIGGGQRLARQAGPQWLVHVAGAAEIHRSYGMEEDEAL